MPRPDDSGFDLSTPRTILGPGDTSYFSRIGHDFNLSIEPSFHSPAKSAAGAGSNLVYQMRNGRAGAINLRTPRLDKSSRAPLNDVRNLPVGLGGQEFTPLLKEATRNSYAQRTGKENSATPGNLTPVQTGSCNASYIQTAPAVYPETGDTTDSLATPLALPARREKAAAKGSGIDGLQDGNQLSLREQENVINKIDKENFNLKLKIHFLQEALMKAGPGYGEQAVKEVTDLKVDKATLQRELQRYKKHLNNAEKDIEDYKSQMAEMHERMKKKVAAASPGEGTLQLRKMVQDLEEALATERAQSTGVEQDLRAAYKEATDRLEEEVRRLRAEVTEKESLYDYDSGKWEDERRTLESERDRAEENIVDLQRTIEKLRESQGKELHTAQTELESEIRGLKEQTRNLDMEKKQLERNLGEEVRRLRVEIREQESLYDHDSAQWEDERRALETKLAKAEERNMDLQRTMEKLRESDGHELRRMKTELESEIRHLEEENRVVNMEKKRIEDSLGEEVRRLRAEIREQESLYDHDSGKWEDERRALETKRAKAEEKNADLQRTLDKLRELKGQELHTTETKLESEIRRLKEENRNLDMEKQHIETNLGEEVRRLRAEIREQESAFDHDSSKWEAERRALEAERTKAEEKIIDLQRTIDKLRESKGHELHTTEMKLESEIRRLKEEIRVIDLEKKNDENSLGEEVRRLRAEIQDHITAYDRDSEKWEDEKRALEAEKAKAEAKIEDLQRTIEKLSESEGQELRTTERKLALEIRRLKEEIRLLDVEKKHVEESLGEEVRRLRAEIREQENVYDHDNDKWEDEKRALEAEKAKAEQKIADLQSTIENLREAQGKELHTAQTELESEIRRLKDEIRVIDMEKRQIEKTLGEEVEKAFEEEEKLDAEIRNLQLQLEQSASRPLEDGEAITKLQQKLCSVERKVKAQQTDLESYAAAEISLRRKLERARSERTQYREAAAAAAREVRKLKHRTRDAEERVATAEDAAEAAEAVAAAADESKAAALRECEAQVAEAKAMVRAAEQAHARHSKELKGMALQMQWMQARWMREASLRADAAYAKRFVQLQLDVAYACNRADLRLLDELRRDLGLLKQPQGGSAAEGANDAVSGRGLGVDDLRKPTLKTFAIAFRFVARARIAARDWQKQEKLRQKLEDKVIEMRRTERVKKLRQTFQDEQGKALPETS